MMIVQQKGCYCLLPQRVAADVVSLDPPHIHGLGTSHPLPTYQRFPGHLFTRGTTFYSYDIVTL